MSYNKQVLIDELQTLLSSTPTLTVSELASRLGVSPKTIQETVKVLKSTCFRKYREKLLLLKVRELLNSSPVLTIKEISIMLGYSSSRSLARAVRRACGVSPVEFRSWIKKDNPDRIAS